MDDPKIISADYLHETIRHGQAEWAAWQVVVSEWKELQLGDFNDEQFSPLIRAIELWGEELSWLRSKQTVETQQSAYDDKQLAYNRAKNRARSE